jgi:hypothetical protein
MPTTNHEIMQKVAKFRQQIIDIKQKKVILKQKTHHKNNSHHKDKMSAFNKQIVTLTKTIDGLLHKIIKPRPTIVSPSHTSSNVDKLPNVYVVKATTPDLPNVNKHNINAISLGNVCRSAVWAVTNQLRKRKIDGYNTCPFDLMITNYAGIVKCINDDFKYFCDLEYLKYVPTEALIKNTYYHFGFNHETPGHADLFLKEKWTEGTNHFVNNKFKHFINRYNERIQHFKDYLNNKNGTTILFCIHFKNETCPSDNLLDLRNALNTKYPHLKYKILILPDKE